MLTVRGMQTQRIVSEDNFFSMDSFKIRSKAKKSSHSMIPTRSYLWWSFWWSFWQLKFAMREQDMCMRHHPSHFLFLLFVFSCLCEEVSQEELEDGVTGLETVPLSQQPSMAREVMTEADLSLTPSRPQRVSEEPNLRIYQALARRLTGKTESRRQATEVASSWFRTCNLTRNQCCIL